MSRTYRHTNGRSKKINSAVKDWIFKGTFSEVHREYINFNDGNDPEQALRLRQGYQWSAPKYFRRQLNKSKKNKFQKQFYQAFKYNSFEDLEKSVEKKDAGWYYF
jgi:hypothetical protein